MQYIDHKRKSREPHKPVFVHVPFYQCIAVYEEALKKNDVHYELYMYEGVNHAFHNNTAPNRYNEAAAKLAWQRTLGSLRNI